MKKILVVGFILLFSLFPICAGADVIGFEHGYAEGSAVGTVNTDTNQVSFWVSKNSSGGVSPAHIAEVGGDTWYAFPTLGLGNDTPSSSFVGSYFLTDRNGQANAENYFMQFSNPVADISLDLYDFDNGDGFVVLTAYSGTTWTGIVASTTPISKQLFDGGTMPLSISSPSSAIYSASLTWIDGAIDDETGIDNISFSTVPIPSAIWLLGSGLIGLVGIRRKFRMS